MLAHIRTVCGMVLCGCDGHGLLQAIGLGECAHNTGHRHDCSHWQWTSAVIDLVPMNEVARLQSSSSTARYAKLKERAKFKDVFSAKSFIELLVPIGLLSIDRWN